MGVDNFKRLADPQIPSDQLQGADVRSPRCLVSTPWNFDLGLRVVQPVRPLGFRIARPHLRRLRSAQPIMIVGVSKINPHVRSVGTWSGPLKNCRLRSNRPGTLRQSVA